MSAEDDLVRARMRREDLEDELLGVDKEIAGVRERGRDTMDILAPQDNARLHQLLDRRDVLQQALSEARTEERFQRRRVEQPRAPQPSPSLTDWKKQRDSERPTVAHERTHERALEPDLDRDR